MRKKEISLRKLIIIAILLIIIPFTICLLGFNLYTINYKINEDLANSHLQKIQLYISLCEETLKTSEEFISSITGNDTNFTVLEHKGDSIEAFASSYSIWSKCSEFIKAQNMAAGFFIYSEKNQLFRKVYNGKIDSAKRLELNENIKEFLSENQDNAKRGWMAASIGGHNYLLQIQGRNGAYIVYAVDLEYISKMGELKEDTDNILVLFDKNGNRLSTTDEIEDNIRLERDRSSYYITKDNKRYFAIQYYSEYIGINSVYLSPYRGLINTMNPIQWTLFIASLLSVMIIPVILYLLKKAFFEPLKQMTRTMIAIKQGNIKIKMDTSNYIQEFRQVDDVFNDMIKQITKLRIKTYEKEIEIQQIQMQYLRIQIHPHFYLNCLKNLYALAENRKFKEIQSMILTFSNYLRSLLKNQSMIVSMSSELQSVDNYMKLLKIGSSVSIQCNINVSPDLKDFEIPPLSILTFVENSVKHGTLPRQELEIYIKAILLKNEEEKFVNITIMDNGPGFSDATLKILNNQNDMNKDDCHIGIRNVIKRYSIMYEHRSTFLFSSSDGARVEIFVPFDRKDVNEW